MTKKTVICFAQMQTPVESFRPAPERLLSGDPAQTVRNHFSDASQQFHSGEWTGECGSWRVHYTESEFCFLTRGRIRLTDTAGTVTEIGPGTAFVIPAGFEGVWEVIEPAHKFYAIFEAASG